MKKYFSAYNFHRCHLMNAQQQLYEVDISLLQMAKMRLCKALLQMRGGEPL